MDADLDDWQLSAYAARQLTRFPSSHHTAPLTYYPQRHVVELMNGTSTVPATVLLRQICAATNQLNNMSGGGYVVTDDPSLAYHYFFSEACLDGTSDQIMSGSINLLDQCITVTLSEIEKDVACLNEAHPGFELDISALKESPNRIRQFSLQLSRCMLARSNLEATRNMVQHNHIQRLEDLCPIPCHSMFAIFVFKEMIFFRHPTEKVIILMNYDQLLMMYDTLSCRFMTRAALLLNSWEGKDNLPTWELIRQLYIWGDNLIERYSVRAYALLGEFEAIVTAVLVTFADSDKLSLGKQFLDGILETAEELEVEHQIPTTEMISVLNILRTVDSVNWLSEIFGLRKHWGNPMVVASESGKAVQERIVEELPIEGSAMVRLLASFNRMVVISYQEQNNSWPKGHFKPGTPDCPLKRAFEDGNYRVLETSHEHRHEHWACFQFETNCILDSYANDLSLLSDKSVSLYKSHLDATYVKNLCSVPVPSHEEDRRLILEYLRTQHMSVLDIFRVVMSGIIPEEWLANTASMKGTEMKFMKARIFAVLTYELRQYFAATEDIIKTHLFPYNPHQTMTLSETDLLTRLKDVTKQLDPNSASRYLAVIHIVDFSKWNLRMKYDNTYGVFKSIDDFFGTPGLIESTHRIFSNMTNIVTDPFNPPVDGVHETESDTIWRNHNCGWEGQRQKGWTILTSAVLSDLERTTGIHSEICGQGDNQTLLTQFPLPKEVNNPLEWVTSRPTDVKRLLDEYYEKLESECKAIGLKIKTAESCRSLCYFNYGKRLYFNGVELSMTLKRISKNITEPNDAYPTSEDILKTLEGSAFAAGLFSHPSLIPYALSRFATAIQLASQFNNNQLIRSYGLETLRGKGYQFNRIFLSTLMKIPPSLGGPPQQSLAAYLFRGHPDPLCTDLVMLTLRARSGCIVSTKIIACALAKQWFSTDAVKKDSLIHAPYSLNLDTPTSCRVPIEKAVLPALRGRCRNELVRSMFAAEMDSVENDIITCLSSMHPFQPLVANDVYSRTPPGRRKAFISGLAHTTSLGRILQEDRSNPMIVRIQHLEAAQLELWMSRVIDVRNMNSAGTLIPAHHVLAQQLRELSWQCEIVGVTVPHPLEQFVLTKSHYDICSDHCCLFLQEHIVLVRHSEDLINLPGNDSDHITSLRSRKGNPYIGSSVAEGIIQRQILCVNPDETWRDIVRLNTIRKWVAEPASPLDDAFLNLIHSRTDVPQAIIDGATGIPSRLSYNHRANLMPVINSCSISTTSNMHTRLYISSNRMGEFSHGEHNYHMPFGPAFLCYQALVCLKGVYSVDSWDQSRENYHIHVRSNDVPKVYDESLDVTVALSRQLNLTDIPPVIFSRRSDLQFEIPSGFLHDSIWSCFDSASLADARMGYATQLIGNSFVKETVVRETVTHDRLDGYTPRNVPVSIGDIRMTSVKSLLKTLAWNFLLLAPSGVYLSTDKLSFQVRSKLFLSSFSSKFWEPFVGPMINVGLTQFLVRTYPGISSYNHTRKTEGVLPMLQHGVISEMWSLFTILQECVTTVNSICPAPLFVPSLPSLKLMLSKYLGLIIHLALGCQARLHREAHEFSRDFSANVLSVQIDEIPSSFSILTCDFMELMQYTGIEGCFLPEIRIYSTQHPWVDKLRSAIPVEPPVLISTELPQPNQYDSTLNELRYTIEDLVITVPISDCTCTRVERRITLHEECYFGLTGRLSKSHMKFLDIVFSKNLRTDGVMCLGSSTGTDAFGFAQLDRCKAVYVNCYIPLSGCTPHAAGSYIPAAFASGMFIDKLLQSSSSAVSCSDLMNIDCANAILTHIGAVTMTGITCDAELESRQNTEGHLAILNTVELIVSQSPSVEWVIIKIPYSCYHDIQRCASIVSRSFIQLDIVKSWFSRPSVNLAYLVGSKRRVVINSNITEHSLPAPIAVSNPLTHFIDQNIESEVLPLFLADRQMLRSKLQLWAFGESSLISAFNNYIPGWFGCTEESLTRDLVRSSVRVLHNSLLDHAQSALRMTSLAHSERRMPRNVILQLDTHALSKVLNQDYLLVAKCDLLLRVTEQPILNLNHCRETILTWLAEVQQYILHDRFFTLKKDSTRFINVDSRYLYEILGHVYKERFECPDHNPTIVNIHYVRPNIYPPQDGQVPVFLGSQNNRPHVNIAWKWDRRSEVCFWLVAKMLIPEPLAVITNSGHIISDFHGRDQLTELHEVPRGPQQMSLALRASSITEIHECLVPGKFIALYIPINLLASVYRIINVAHLIKCPWSGFSPDSVIVVGQMGGPTDREVGRYPNFSPTYNIASPDGVRFIMCSCYDCSMEQYLCEQFRILHSDLDRLCSLGVIESVRDHSHML